MTASRTVVTRWESALLDLANELDMTLHVERYEFPERRRTIGDWWRNKDQWCVHLDYRTYAWFEGAAASHPMVQRAISWSLVLLNSNQSIRWQDILVDWALELTSMPRQDLFAQVRRSQSMPIGANLTLRLPGYFVCLSIDEGSSRRSDADTRSLVSEVVEALLPHGWIAWLPEDEGLNMAIVYAAAEDMLSDVEQVSSGEMEKDALDVVFLMMRQLTEALAAEAMVSGKAAVGALVTKETLVYSGLATAVASWKTRDWMSVTDTVVGWGSDPAQTLLLALSAEATDTFMEVAQNRMAAENLQLSAEFIETLNGLIAANLNVSEASRLLYLHRNTLMNRIDKIKQQTGYDVRIFRDAMTLWLVSAVQRMTQCP